MTRWSQMVAWSQLTTGATECGAMILVKVVTQQSADQHIPGHYTDTMPPLVTSSLWFSEDIQRFQD